MMIQPNFQAIFNALQNGLNQVDQSDAWHCATVLLALRGAISHGRVKELAGVCLDFGRQFLSMEAEA